MSFQKPTHQYDVSLAASSTKRVFELSLTCIIRIIDMTQSKVFTNRYFGNSWSVDFQNSFGIGFYLAQFLLYFAQIKTKQFSNSEFSVVYLPLISGIWLQFSFQLVFCRRGVIQNIHYVKSVCIRSFSSPFFSAFGLNTDQKNSECGHFSRSNSHCAKNEVFH